MSERGTKNQDTISMAVVVTSGFNLAATMAFLDPFRAANYLRGFPVADWTILSSDGGLVPSSAGLTIESMSLASYTCIPDIAIVSTSWTPEAFFGPPIDASLRRWVRFGAQLGALDTGAFILAKAGLISGKRVTVHYEHVDSFAEMFPDISITEDLYVFDRDCYTACGGSAGTDLAIQLIRQFHGDALANSVARYIFHDRLRPEATRQLPEDIEPLGPTIPLKLRHAIQEMERHLEEPLSIADLARCTRLSQRQMG
jgi:AraC family carnitine catabolism transcriptional activator